jgi:hypothetical protein
MTCHSEIWPQKHPNGTTACGDSDHVIGELVPAGLAGKERVTWIVDHLPALTDEQVQRLAILLRP